MINNPGLHDEASKALAQSIGDALHGTTDKHSSAATLRHLPYHAIYDPAEPGVIHDMAIPAVIIALGEPELAIERFVASIEREPKDMQDVIWTKALDPIRCDERFQAQMPRLGIIDNRANRICQ